MAHACFYCGGECYCHGDIDDVVVSNTPSNCDGCGCGYSDDDWRDDDYDDDEDDEEAERLQCLKRVEDAYYDRHSPHYRDNERFRWAVETINKKFKK